MDNSKLVDEDARLYALHRYEILNTPLDPSFDKITSLVRMLLSVPIAAVSLVDAERQWFKSMQGLDVCETARDISFCTHAIKAYEPMLVPDALLDPRFSENPLVLGEPFIRSYAGVPLRTPDGYNIGSLCAIDMVPRTYDAATIEILKNVASLVIDELELWRIVRSDHLTGAVSRRAFLSEAGKSITKFERSGTPSCLLLLDIDRFKSVNDTWGHPTGDLVLRAVSKCCQEALRAGDTFGRIGGEEFAILLNSSKPEESFNAAERFRLAIESLVVEHSPPLKVTASFGISSLKEAGMTPDGWLAAADRGLYAAKGSGRNKCVDTDSLV